MKQEIKFLGITEENSSCDRCGRSDLQRTYAIELESGEVLYLGSSCFAHRFEMSNGTAATWLNSEAKKLKRQIEANARKHASDLYTIAETQRDLPGNNYWTPGVKQLFAAARAKEAQFIVDAQPKKK